MHRAPFSRSVQSLLHLLSCFRGSVTSFPYTPTRENIFCLLHGHFSISFLSSCTGLHLSAFFVQLLIIVSFHAVPYPLSSIGTSCRHSFFSQPRLPTALHSDFTLLWYFTTFLRISSNYTIQLDFPSVLITFGKRSTSFLVWFHFPPFLLFSYRIPIRNLLVH